MTMGYDLLIAGDISFARLREALARIDRIPVDAVDIAEADVEDRNWQAAVLCTYEPRAGDITWSLDIYVSDAAGVQRPAAETAEELAHDLGVPVLYDAVGTPGAATDPRLVGSDPWVLHLSVDALAGSEFDGTWRSTRTYELASGFWNGATVTVAIARDPHALPTLGNALEKDSVATPAPVTVAGRPGTMVKATSKWAPKADYTLQWQPVPGLWARIEAESSTPSQALEAAAAVRFDQATRCAQPFAVGALPAGVRIQYCQVALIHPPTGLTYGDGEVDFGGAGRGFQLKATRTIPGWPTKGVARNVGGLTFSLVSTGTGTYTRQELIDVLDSIHLVGSPGDPSTYR